MQTINDIFTAFKLTQHDIEQLSDEAKAVAVNCGSTGANKTLNPDTWDLFDEMSVKVWDSELSNKQKITLAFSLYEHFPGYNLLLPFYHGICYKEIVGEAETNLIWKQFLGYLESAGCYADPVAYTLWVEFFEDEATVGEAWLGMIRNCSNKKTLLRLLELAGPVPYDLKEVQYESLLSDESNHETIFNSLLYSAYEVFGKIDKTKAVAILAKLNLDPSTQNHKMLIDKLKM